MKWRKESTGLITKVLGKTPIKLSIAIRIYMQCQSVLLDSAILFTMLLTHLQQRRERLLRLLVA